MSAEAARKPNYRNPPAEHRFQKGHSGNPRGRPRKGDTRSLPSPSFGDLFTKIAREPVHITINGQPRRVSGEEAFIRSLLARALKGEARATKLYADLLLKFGGTEQPALSHEDFLALMDEDPPGT